MLVEPPISAVLWWKVARRGGNKVMEVAAREKRGRDR